MFAFVVECRVDIAPNGFARGCGVESCMFPDTNILGGRIRGSMLFHSHSTFSVIAGYAYAVKMNPDELEYQDTLQHYLNESAMISSKVRNPEVDEHFRYMVDCYTHGLVRR